MFEVQCCLPDPSQLPFHLWCLQPPWKGSQLGREVPTLKSSLPLQGGMGLSSQPPNWPPGLLLIP